MCGGKQREWADGSAQDDSTLSSQRLEQVAHLTRPFGRLSVDTGKLFHLSLRQRHTCDANST